MIIHPHELIIFSLILAEGAKTIEEQLYDTLLDVQEAWAEENYERIADEFYPEKSLKVIQSLGVLWGKKGKISGHMLISYQKDYITD